MKHKNLTAHLANANKKISERQTRFGPTQANNTHTFINIWGLSPTVGNDDNGFPFSTTINIIHRTCMHVRMASGCPGDAVGKIIVKVKRLQSLEYI